MMHIQIKRALCATSALAGGLLLASSALAQSTTGSATVEELVVTGSSGPTSLSGVIEQTAPKTRTTIDQEFIARQMPGQTVADSLNVVPGYNFTNNDAYGNSGGNIRLRSFDCARISFQWDGMQLNDSGNYACYTNQVGDSEIVSTADVAQGTTDVDAPSASATGGAINYRTKVPDRDFHVYTNIEGGSFNYRRGFLEVDSGEIGPWGTRFFVAGSSTRYDKFKGPGELAKDQFNARIYQPLRDNGDFASLAFHWNKNRNNFYNNPTLQDYRNVGYAYDEDRSCTLPTPVAGTRQDANQSTVVNYLGNTVTGSCTGYYNVRINPSDTGNIRGQFKYHLRDNVIFTFDPNFQYVLANGGGFAVVSETDNRLRGAGAPSGPGHDLNGDGDTLDSVALYTPNTTNTRRYGINSSLIWDINDDHRVRLAYALDYARHRQTGEYTYLAQNGDPLDVFGGKDGYGPKVPTTDGSFLRGRDRASVAQLNMFAAEYIGHFMDENLEVRLGVRAPFFKRELNNFCYSQNNSSNVLCTTAPVTATLANGNVNLAGSGTTQYIAPYRAEKKYDDVLPNIGVSYKLGGGHSVYASYAEGLSAPRTDNLYTVTRAADGSIQNPLVQPETTQTVDLGYRFTTPNIQASIALYDSKFQNRIASSFDPDLGIFIDRNIGDVDIKGVDAGVAWQVADYLTYIGNLSYNHAIVQNDTQQGTGTFLPTKGKRLVETPDWQWFQRVQWEISENFSLGVQAKWVGRRYSTDVNDEKTPSYATVDADLRWTLPKWDDHEAYLQLNVKNLFDEKYLGSISSQSNAQRINFANGTFVNGLSPRYSPGSPRAFQVTLHVGF
jgi:iron complex outermembrane receptor protein